MEGENCNIRNNDTLPSRKAWFVSFMNMINRQGGFINNINQDVKKTINVVQSLISRW